MPSNLEPAEPLPPQLIPHIYTFPVPSTAIDLPTSSPPEGPLYTNAQVCEPAEEYLITTRSSKTPLGPTVPCWLPVTYTFPAASSAIANASSWLFPVPLYFLTQRESPRELYFIV